MANEKINVNEIISERSETLKKEINLLLEKSKTEKLSLMDYYSLYMNYKFLQEKSEYQEEIENYKKIIKQIMSDDSVVHTAEDYCCLSDLYFDEKLYDRCFASLNKAIELDPNNAELYLVKANFCEQLGKHKISDSLYSKAIELNPELEHIIKLLKKSDATIKEVDNIYLSIYIIVGAFVLFAIYFIAKFVILTFNLFFG